MQCWVPIPKICLSHVLRKVLACSPYVADILERRPDMLRELVDSGRLARALDAGEAQELFARTAADGPSESEFESRLRWLRHRELTRIVSGATWPALHRLKKRSLNYRLLPMRRSVPASIGRSLCWSHGTASRAVRMVRWPVSSCSAMGKLGGRELNFSSDVDLIFCFTEHGETDGERTKSNEEFFRLLAQRVVSVLSKKTGDGFVYRVDIRLRPFGNSGPVAVSLPALETYLAQHGRDWERYAYVKARVMNDWDGTRITSTMRSFVPSCIGVTWITAYSVRYAT